MTLWAWFIQESIQKFKHGILIKKEFFKKWMLYSYMLLKRGGKILRMEAGENYPIKNSQTHELLGYTDRQEDRQEER